jgi:hypothetical protein
MTTYNELRQINVNEKVEKKEGLTYLSWSWAWDEFKQAYPEATYEVVKNPEGLPYFESHAGAMVYTKVTADNLTHEMWLPVMDSKNKAMKAEPYKYSTRNGEKTVEAFSMFDVNKALMRCLVKNLAMFGLALYIYSGEDLPSEEPIDLSLAAKEWTDTINQCKTIDELKDVYGKAYNAVAKDKNAVQLIANAKDLKKVELS